MMPHRPQFDDDVVKFERGDRVRVKNFSTRQSHAIPPSAECFVAQHAGGTVTVQWKDADGLLLVEANFSAFELEKVTADVQNLGPGPGITIQLPDVATGQRIGFVTQLNEKGEPIKVAVPPRNAIGVNLRTGRLVYADEEEHRTTAYRDMMRGSQAIADAKNEIEEDLAAHPLVTVTFPEGTPAELAKAVTDKINAICQELFSKMMEEAINGRRWVPMKDEMRLIENDEDESLEGWPCRAGFAPS